MKTLKFFRLIGLSFTGLLVSSFISGFITFIIRSVIEGNQKPLNCADCNLILSYNYYICFFYTLWIILSFLIIKVFIKAEKSD